MTANRCITRACREIPSAKDMAAEGSGGKRHDRSILCPSSISGVDIERFHKKCGENDRSGYTPSENNPLNVKQTFDIS